MLLSGNLNINQVGQKIVTRLRRKEKKKKHNELVHNALSFKQENEVRGRYSQNLDSYLL